MNSTSASKLYLLFALLMLSIGWKVTHELKVQLKNAQAQQEARIEAILSTAE